MLQDKRLLTPTQLAKMLGVDRATVYYWAKTGKLTHIRVGHRIYIEPADAAEMVTVHERKEAS